MVDDTVGVTLGLMVIVVLPEVAVEGVAQARLEVSTQVTISPLFSVPDENVDPVPTLEPLTCHWQVGDPPPFVGVAENPMDCPEQEGLLPELTETATDGATFPVTVIVIGAEVTVAGEAQEEFEVIIHVTT